MAGARYRNKAIEATTFIILGFGISQFIRLAGNLVLTRLLFPELFGFMALAQVFITGLHMLSDIGLEPAIIRSERANEASFLNTAWTLQVIRGLMIAALAFAVAAPVAALYDQPMLRFVIPAIGLAHVPRDFSSTSIATLNRELRQKILTCMELTIQIVSLLSMIAFAYVYRNVWALVAGQLVASIMYMVWSHSINSGRPNRLLLEKDAVTELLSFGKWIFVSTAMTFLAAQTDRLLLGRLFPMGLLGVYSISVMLAGLPQQVISRLGSKVVFPLVAKFAHLPRLEMRRRIERPRGFLLVSGALLVALLTCFGDLLVSVLYDERYIAAAWIFPILVIGFWPVFLVSSIEGALYAIGKPVYGAIGKLVKVVYLALALPASYRVAGAFGAVIVVALDSLPVYVLTNAGLWKEKLSLMRQDLWATCLLLTFVAGLLLVRDIIGLGIPWTAGLSLY